MKKTLGIVLFTLCAVSTVQAAEDKRPDFSAVCKGKALNSKVAVKHNGETRQGTCQLGFKANVAHAVDRGAMRNLQDICKNKTAGTAMTAKVNGKNVAGKCEVNFRMQRS